MAPRLGWSVPLAVALLALLPAWAVAGPAPAVLVGPGEYRLFESAPDAAAYSCWLAGASWSTPLKGTLTLALAEGPRVASYTFVADGARCAVTRFCPEDPGRQDAVCLAPPLLGYLSYHLGDNKDGTYHFRATLTDLLFATEHVSGTVAPP